MTAYSDVVRATAGKLAYWRMGQKFGDCPEADGLAPPIGLIGGVTRNVTGPLTHGDGGAVSFNGTDASGVVELDLSTYNVLSVEFWLKWDEYQEDDDLAMEFTANFNSVQGGWLVDPNNGGGNWGVGIGDSGERRNNAKFANPSAGAWHHYVFVFDRRAATEAAKRVLCYVDGHIVTIEKEASGTPEEFFAKSILNLMSRNGESLFGSGDMAHLAIYEGKMSPLTVLDHWEKRLEEGTEDVEPEGEKNEEEEGGGGGKQNGPHSKPPFYPRNHSFDATVGSIAQIRAAAANPSNAGKVVGIKSGSYNTLDFKGSSGHPPNMFGPPLAEPAAPVTFIPVPGGKVKIKGMEGRWTHNIIFEGIIWEGGGIELVSADDFSEPFPYDPGEAYRNGHIEFFGCEWMGGALECFYSQAWTDHITFEGCYMHDTDTPDSTDVGYGIHSSGGNGLNRYLTVRRCLFENFSNDMIQLSSFENVLIDRCELVGQVRQNEASHPDVVQAFGCKNIKLTNCKVWKGGIEQAFFFEYGWGGVCEVSNCLLMESTTKKLWWTGDCEVYGTIIVKNNTLISTLGCYIQCSLREPLVDTDGVFIVEDNIFDQYDVLNPDTIREESGNIITGTVIKPENDPEYDENFVSRKHPGIGYQPPTEVWWYIPPEPISIGVGREYPPDEIAVSVFHPDGSIKARWAEDEWNVENVITGLQIGKECPGGDKSLNGELGRDPQREWDDLTPYDDIVARQKTGDVVFEGYLDETPDTSGNKISITPAALGNQAILEDDGQIRLGFISADLGKFTDPSAERRKILHNAGQIPTPSMVTGFREAGEEPPGAFIEYLDDYGEKIEALESWWDGEGCGIGEVHFDFKVVFAGGDPNFNNYVSIALNDLRKSPDYVNGTNLANTPSKTHEIVTALERGWKWALIVSAYIGTYEGESGPDVFGYENMRFIGDHGLPIQGTWPNIGFTAKQMITYLIQTYGAPLKVDPDNIEDDQFLIPEAWYGSAGNAASILKDLVKYSLYDWFVYHDKQLEFRRPGSYGRQWLTYVEESELNEVGVDSKRLWKSVAVQYQDANGRTLIVGPPGSGADTVTGGLEITDPQHPAVQARRARNALLDMKGASNAQEAARVGERFLEEANLLSHAGSVTLTGYSLDSQHTLRPVAQINAGDYLRVLNASDGGFRKIINTTYNHDARSIECDLDAPASGMEALLERLQVGLISQGVS